MKREIAKGAAWMVLFKLGERSLGLVSTLILARLLVPGDFGLVAMAMSVIGIVELASAFSFEVALIQKDRPERRHYDTAWTLNVMLGAVCALITALLAYPAAAFYGEDRLMPVMLVLAVAWLAASFENVGTVDFRRTMNFSKEFAFLSSKKLVSFVVTVSLAFALQSYWALVAGAVAGRFSGLVLSFAMSPYRPRFSLAASRELFSFSGWLLMINVLSVAHGKLPHFFVGRVHGPQALGLYTVGGEIAYLPATELIAPINRAVFPGYARMATSRDALRQGFVDVIAVILVFALPASIGVAVIADPLVRVLLGPKWVDAIPIIQILAVSGAITAATSNNFSAYLALGRPSITASILLTRLVVLALLLPLLGRELGLVGVAYAELVASVASLAVSYPALFKALELSPRTYLASLWRPLAASVAMGFAVHALLGELRAGAAAVGPLLEVLSSVLAGAAVYVALLLLLWWLSGLPRGSETFLVARAVEIVGRIAGTRRDERGGT